MVALVVLGLILSVRISETNHGLEKLFQATI